MKKHYKKMVHKARKDLINSPIGNLILMAINVIFSIKIVPPSFWLAVNFIRRVFYIETYFYKGPNSERAINLWDKIVTTTENVRCSGNMGELLVDSTIWVRIGMFILMLMVMQVIWIQIQALLKAVWNRQDRRMEERNRKGKH